MGSLIFITTMADPLLAKKKTFTIKPKKAVVGAPQQPQRIPTTLGEEVDAALAEWYGTRGLPVPPEEVGLGAIIDAEEREKFRKELEGAVVAAAAAASATAAGPKPEFGTPEFWAWARKRKLEKDAERAAKGLPPEPTKAEKAAAKAAKAAAKK